MKIETIEQALTYLQGKIDGKAYVRKGFHKKYKIMVIAVSWEPLKAVYYIDCAALFKMKTNQRPARLDTLAGYANEFYNTALEGD